MVKITIDVANNKKIPNVGLAQIDRYRVLLDTKNRSSSRIRVYYHYISICLLFRFNMQFLHNINLNNI